ncbi:MAG TPA: hypothetical protein VGK20_18225 [Candidatus Binatia bacterium]
MAGREGSLWSRGWGVIALAAFAVHLGASVYEAAVIAPLWSVAPPKSVTAWASLPIRPDSATFFHSLVAVIGVASLMAWISGLSARGWRRWWLTLMLACAVALAVITVVTVMPLERELFGGGALGDKDGASLVAMTGDWVRAAAFRFAALIVGAWSAWRAQVCAIASRRVEHAVAHDDAAFVIAAEPSRAVRTRRPREFSFGDEDDVDVTIGDEAVTPRDRWRRSLPGGRRTAKK